LGAEEKRQLLDLGKVEKRKSCVIGSKGFAGRYRCGISQVIFDWYPPLDFLSIEAILPTIMTHKIGIFIHGFEILKIP